MNEFAGFYRVFSVIDGDSIIVEHTISKQLSEVRFYGIDAPEIKKCNKLLQDERETHIAGGLLMHLGKLSAEYLRRVCPVETKISIEQEASNSTDVYGRMLAYVHLHDGTCINEIMIREGYAKPFSKYFCKDLKKYQQLNIFARTGKKGLYKLVKNF